MALRDGMYIYVYEYVCVRVFVKMNKVWDE